MSDPCPLCGTSPAAAEALRARVAEVERRLEDEQAQHEITCQHAERHTALLQAERDEACRERDARPDPGALLAALDAIRAAAATGARPAELARMIEDVQAGCIRPPTGDATLLTTKEPS